MENAFLKDNWDYRLRRINKPHLLYYNLFNRYIFIHLAKNLLANVSLDYKSLALGLNHCQT